ncbi:DUF1599 domain-containing protein [Hydrotalea sp.]|uniref:DUF1599 domain-containing protein n=1 Tax=Hydrotalea sp. TaxID=2881279 RepID=UPI003D14A9FE
MDITSQQYDAIIEQCKKIFIQKAADYGTAWRVLRIISVVDQLFIKALRIRTIQDKKVQLVADDITSEFKGIVNYAVIGLIQLEINQPKVEELPLNQVAEWYEKEVNIAKQVMQNKNHDYGEAWRDMSQESFADLILMKLMRIKQILANDGKTLVSEGIDANFIDIINYAVFALILMPK